MADLSKIPETDPRRGTEATVSASPLSRIAGPIAIVAGALVVLTRLPTVLFLLTGDQDLTAFVLGATHAITGVASIVAFALLVLALVAVYEREAARAGWLGLIGLASALVGTIFMAGDWWYEAFAVPRIAEVAPDLITTFVGGRLLMKTWWPTQGLAQAVARLVGLRANPSGRADAVNDDAP